MRDARGYRLDRGRDQFVGAEDPALRDFPGITHKTVRFGPVAADPSQAQALVSFNRRKLSHAISPVRTCSTIGRSRKYHLRDMNDWVCCIPVMGSDQVLPQPALPPHLHCTNALFATNPLSSANIQRQWQCHFSHCHAVCRMVARSVYRGCQPGTSRARPASPTRHGGSPGRRGAMRCGICFPTTCSAVVITSLTEKPLPLPGLKALKLSWQSRQSSALICASARSVTWI
jgi:hypothetical protein